MRFLHALVIAFLLSPFSQAFCQTSGWVFPSSSSYVAGAGDNGKILSTENAPGGSITVTLPTPSVVGQGWEMGFSEANGKGVIVNAPGGIFILAGQKTMMSFTMPSNTNYEYFALQSDGTNFRLLAATSLTARTNGILGTVGGQSWTFLFTTGYSSTLNDNGTTLTSSLAGGPVTLTLPSTSLLPNGWAITLVTAASNPITIQPNSVSGGTLLNPLGTSVSSYALPALPSSNSALVSFDGSSFHVVAQPSGSFLFVSQFGADLTGAVDATAAVNACLSAAGLGGTCRVDRNAKLLLLGNVLVPAQRTLSCGLDAPTDLNPPLVSSSLGSALRTDPNHPILYTGTSATAKDCLIIPNGMTFPQTSSVAWTGTAIDTQGNTAPQFINLMIAGFDTCIYTTTDGVSSLRPYFNHVYVDCRGVTRGGSIVTGSGGDLATLMDVKLQALGTNATCPARTRQGTGLKLIGSVWMDRVISQDFQVANYSFSNTGGILVGAMWSDYFQAGGCVRGSSVGVAINNVEDLYVDHLDLNGTQIGMTIQNQGNVQATHFNNIFLNGIGSDGIVLGANSGTGTQQSAGVVQIDMLNTNQNSGNVGRYAINYVDGLNSTTLTLNGGMIWSVNGGAGPYIKVPQTTSINKIHISDTIQSDLTNYAFIWGPPTLTACSGVGSGSCSLQSQLHASPWSGTIILSPTGSPGTSGNIDIFWPLTMNTTNSCVASYQSGSAGWGVTYPIQMVQLSSIETRFQWMSANALTAGQTYQIPFLCSPQ